MLRVSNLGQKHRRGNLSQAVSESHHDTTAHEGVDVLGSTLEDGTNDHDDAADGNGRLSAKSIGQNGSKMC